MSLLRIASVLVIAAMLQPMAWGAERPNVIVVFSDDAGWADFGFQDDITGRTTVVPTPHLDSLAARGVRFSDAYAASVCSPTRAMLTTGMYGARIGYENNIASSSVAIGNQQTQGLPLSAVTVWEHMQAAGYATAAVGKWHLGAHVDNTATGELGNRPQNQGIEVFQGIISGSRSYTVGGASGDDAIRRTLSNGAGGGVTDQIIESQFNGQYVTDVFGDLSVDYIADHHAASDPFFLYTSFTAPHTPLQATNADLAAVDALGLGITGQRRTQVAMQIALDRNVGKILSALDDPNGDNNTSDSIRDNTLVLFLNDNGGDSSDADPNFSDNRPLRNGKGSQFDGGIRIPMIVAGAGVDPSVHGSIYNSPVHLIDVVPTVMSAAGGTFGPGVTIDGVDLLPFVNGTAAGVPHESLYIRRGSNDQSAVRVGDWKLMYQNGTGFQLYNLVTDIGESNNVAAANPQLVEQLQQVMTSYDVQMDKARYDLRVDDVSQFDAFRFREDAFSQATWSTANAWVDNEGGGNATLRSGDAYANAVLVFRNKSAGDYTATNDLIRIGGLQFMANQIRLEQRTDPLTTDGRATINGQGVLLAKNLSGDLPAIKLDAALAGAHTFTFDLVLPIDLYDDLQISGDGDQQFIISGDIREYRPGLNITKVGSANLNVAGDVSVTGQIDLQAGVVQFTSGQVAGHARVRGGATVRVGGVGIVPGSGTPGPAPVIVTTGLELDYSAANDVGGDATWTDSAAPASNLAFGGVASPTTVTSGMFPAVSQAYSIPVVGGAQGLNNYFESTGPRSQRDATFELVVNVTDVSAGTNQVLFEAGGVDRGAALVLNNNQLTFNVDGDATDINLNTTLTAGWHHIVGVIDLDAAGADAMRLFVDNSLVGTIAGQTIGDWAGGNTTGLGAGFSSVTGVTAGVGNPFHGSIALARYYNSVAFSATETNQNYQTLLYTPGLPGQPAVTLAVEGSWTQEAGSILEIDLLSSDAYDQLTVTGSVELSGTLRVAASAGADMNAGDQYTIVQGANVTGQFAELDLPTLAAGLMWQPTYGAQSLNLVVTVAGDYNADGQVDAADYTTWRDSLGSSVSRLTGADGDGDGQVTNDDLAVWRANFGQQVSALSSAAAVPEPSSWMLALAGYVACRRSLWHMLILAPLSSR